MSDTPFFTVESLTSILSSTEPPTSRETVRPIVSAFVKESSKLQPCPWRTLSGVSHEAGLSLPEVTDFVKSHSTAFELSPLAPSGSTELYRLRAAKLTARAGVSAKYKDYLK